MGVVRIEEGSQVWVASFDMLLRVMPSEASVSVVLSGRGLKASDVLSSSNLIRFVGGCLAAGYGMADFEAEVVSKTKVETERIRIEKEGMEGDRAFIVLNPEEFIYIGKMTSKTVGYTKCQIEFHGNRFELEFQERGLLVAIEDSLGKREEVFLHDRSQIFRFFASMLASAFGREKSLQRVGTEDKSLVVGEKIEIKENTQKLLEVSLKRPDGSVVKEVRTIEEWVRQIRENAKKAGKSANAMVRAFLRQRGVPFDSKVFIRIKDVEMRLPPHWALGIYEVFEKHL
ncbi:MAG: hypothetical protein ACO2PP_00050 [Thermocrinis sp.]|jgi:hypothetical protein|uniref:hypothetical protein n=1 Tax=Thermocrinis sp. TaxID=2024383 RepID=UPI003C0603EA